MEQKNLSRKQFSIDLLLVLLSNLITLAGSIVSGMLIPKIMGVEEFSYYNIYTLYLTYTSLLHFGFVDGILLKFAGRDYSSLVGERFRAYSRFYIRFQSVTAALLIAAALLFLPPSHKLVFVFIGLNMLSLNIISYYQYISQDTMRFKELSARKVLQALLKIILAFALWYMVRSGRMESGIANVYIIGVIIIDFLLMFWYIYTYRDITFGKSDSLAEAREEIFSLFREGIFLTLSYWISNLIYVLDKQFVSLFFDSTVYGIYSFANKLIATASGFVLAVSLVLFPRLKRLTVDRILETFPSAMAAISAVSCAALIFYEPLCVIIRRFLSEYTGSVIYLRILFPGLVFMCCINIIISTYFNALGRQRIFFLLCCIVLVCAVGLNSAACFAFKDPAMISAALIISLLLLYLLGVGYFARRFNVSWIRNTLYIIIMTAVYYLTSFLMPSALMSFAVYAAVYIIVTALFYFRQLKKFIRP